MTRQFLLLENLLLGLVEVPLPVFCVWRAGSIPIYSPSRMILCRSCGFISPSATVSTFQLKVFSAICCHQPLMALGTLLASPAAAPNLHCSGLRPLRSSALPVLCPFGPWPAAPVHDRFGPRSPWFLADPVQFSAPSVQSSAASFLAADCSGSRHFLPLWRFSALLYPPLNRSGISDIRLRLLRRSVTFALGSGLSASRLL